MERTTGCIFLPEDPLTGGVGAELAAWISEPLFGRLDARVKRVGGLDTPIPFAIPLEQNFMPVERFREVVKKLASY